MRRMLARYEASLFLVLTVCVCLAGAWVISFAVPLPSREGFNVARWEMRHLPDKWLYLAGRSLRGGLSESEEDERFGRFLLLSARVRQLERTVQTADAARVAELGRLLRERDALENEAEAII